MRGVDALKILDAAAERSPTPASDQTTIRLSKDVRRRLKVIAATNGVTLVALAETILSDLCGTYQREKGVELRVRRRA